MNFYIKTHIVKKGETLEQIAKMYHIPEVQMLRDFHNKNVPEVCNCIGWTIITGHELFIPQDDDIQRIINQRKTKAEERSEHYWANLLNRDFIFPFKNGKYSYSITIKEPAKEGIHSFFWEAEHLFQNEERRHFLLKINQGEIKYNNDLPDSTVELMASDINRVFFPIEVLVNEKGLIDRVDKLFAIQQNWNNNISDLYEFYEGRIGNLILNEVKEKMSDSKKLAYLLNFNILWALLLRGVTGHYENGKCEKNISLISQYMKCIAKNRIIKNENHADGFYNISQEIFEQERLEKIITATYTLDIKSHILKKAEIKLQNMHEDLNISIIQTQMS